MNTLKKLRFYLIQYPLAWAVHAFTASAAFIGALTLWKIYQGEFTQAMWLMALSVLIDGLDGTFARMVRVKTILPSIDGALLDNIVDFLNYVITPCFFLLVKENMLPPTYALWIIAAITTASAYQFCQLDAKTPDHFFKGFPCYWNIVVFYMFIFDTSMWTNAVLLILFCILVFIPIKYVYPSRLDYLTSSKKLKILMHICSASYGISAIFILSAGPNPHPIWLVVSLGYVFMYTLLSFYRTLSPMIKAKIYATRLEKKR